MKTPTEHKSNQKLGIGDVAKKLNLKPFVIRFWEREFGIKSRRSSGGQRCYTAKDIEYLTLIKRLLHEDGLTIAGAKKILDEHKAAKNIKLTVTAATRDVPGNHASSTIEDQTVVPLSQDLHQQLHIYKSQLIRLKELLNNTKDS